MSLQFIAGPSGCGKSWQEYQQLISESVRRPEQQFLVIVPEQFTMQTQKEILEMHPRKGLLNIDILSFNRLAWRVFAEVGGNSLPVLEDTGKSLVVRHVIAEKKTDLHMLSRTMDRQGASAEMTSFISELLQYRVEPEDLDDWVSAQSDAHHVRLAAKLADVRTVYQAFLDYLEGHYLTTEEVPEMLCNVIDRSQLVRGSVIVLDGFTGFTPVQNKVVEKLLRLAADVRIIMTCSSPDELAAGKNIHGLFHMSRQMYDKTLALARDTGTEVLPVKWITPSEKSRLSGSPALTWLEKNIFRFGRKEPFLGEQKEIRILEAADPAAEIRAAAEQILRMVREEGYRWRDFAIITGDLESSGAAAADIFEQAGIPYFLDQKTPVLDNPAVEFIRSAIDMEIRQYSYESVFRYLRSGMSGFSAEETDNLETYVLALGIRNRSQYEKEWIRMPKTGAGGSAPDGETRSADNRNTAGVTEADGDNTGTESLIEDDADSGGGTTAEYFNRLRVKFLEDTQAFHDGFHERMSSARRKSEVLYRFITEHDVQGKLEAYAETFREEGDDASASEYSQMYRALMDLLDKIAGVLDDERLSMAEYQQILDAGFGEISIGMVPGGEDQVMIGDIERTRLKKIRVMFFTGLNDGIIPRPVSPKGILSESDRSYLEQSGAELSPGVREQMFQQRFYLYLAMTKPSDHLYLSYSRTDNAGTVRKPSYLAGMVQKLFDPLPVITAEDLEAGDLTRVFETKAGEISYLLGQLQGMPARDVSPAGKEILRRMGSRPENRREAQRLLDARNSMNRASSIGSRLAEKLYGRNIRLSVTRLEQFAGCPFSHFLNYGLRLQEREIYGFEMRDFGNIMHDALRIFSQTLKTEGRSWRTLTDSERNIMADRALESAAGAYGNAVLVSTERDRFRILRLQEVLRRTVWALQQQILRGSFEPVNFEYVFGRENPEELAFSPDGRARLCLQGKIDRLDICDADGVRYLKVIDYKTGGQELDLNRVYSGLQLQLVLYMKAACGGERKITGRETEPAGIFYYHIADPLIDETDVGKKDDGDVDALMLTALRPLGIVRSETAVERLFDGETPEGKSSAVLPSGVKIGRGEGEGAKLTDNARPSEDFRTIMDYVTRETQSLGRRMVTGCAEVAPALQYKGSTGKDACEYCAARGICGYDERIAGYSHRRINSAPADDVILKMKRELAEDGAGREQREETGDGEELDN